MGRYRRCCAAGCCAQPHAATMSFAALLSDTLLAHLLENTFKQVRHHPSISSATFPPPSPPHPPPHQALPAPSAATVWCQTAPVPHSSNPPHRTRSHTRRSLTRPSVLSHLAPSLLSSAASAAPCLQESQVESKELVAAELVLRHLPFSLLFRAASTAPCLPGGWTGSARLSKALRGQGVSRWSLRLF